MLRCWFTTGYGNTRAKIVRFRSLYYAGKSIVSRETGQTGSCHKSPAELELGEFFLNSSQDVVGHRKPSAASYTNSKSPLQFID